MTLHLGAGHGTCFTPQEFDTIARLETQSIDAYNDAHHYRPEPIDSRIEQLLELPVQQQFQRLQECFKRFHLKLSGIP